ncbi:hypothetical protein NW766_001818 [Fusarium irregulare]|uniref:Uncharacterized protein n=1 Tax=Fusarium irregulare TaxID=2494466 RepID=A0A9W8UFA1_9HYPO|nr:hypothetical protein NW766_001818 [Fusarium irregulare]
MSAPSDLPLEHYPPGTAVEKHNESQEATPYNAPRLPDSATETSPDNHGSVPSDNNRNVDVAGGSSDNATKQKSLLEPIAVDIGNYYCKHGSGLNR